MVSEPITLRHQLWRALGWIATLVVRILQQKWENCVIWCKDDSRNGNSQRKIFKSEEIGLDGARVDRSDLRYKWATEGQNTNSNKEPSAEGNSRGRLRGDRSSTHHNHYHTSKFSQWSIIKFLTFSGKDLKSWLFKIDKLFIMKNVSTEEKIRVAALQLEGEAIQSHLSFMRYRQYLHPAIWMSM